MYWILLDKRKNISKEKKMKYESYKFILLSFSFNAKKPFNTYFGYI